MGRKTAFRLTVMMAFLVGVAYGASQIGQLPAGPREIVARVGKWLQRQADATPVEVPESVAPSSDPPTQLALEPLVGPQGGLAEFSGPQPFDRAVAEAAEPTEVLPLETAVLPPNRAAAESFGQVGSAVGVDSPPTEGDLQLDTMASRLRELGATHYQLEKWGEGGRLFRFTCEVPVGNEHALRQHFEAVADSGASAINQVLEQVGRQPRSANDVGP